MPGYICSKCGSRGSSKNIATRTFFPANQMAAALSHALTVSTPLNDDTLKDKTYGVVHVRFGFTPQEIEEIKSSKRPYREFMERVCMEFVDYMKYHGGDGKTHEAYMDWACEHDYVAQGEVEC